MQRLILFLFIGAAFRPSLPAQSNADCMSAMEICKKQSYTIGRTGGEGSDNIEADFMACFMNGENFGQAEENSTWIKFEIAKSGNLTFVITPEEPTDDIDFVLFKLPAGDCTQKKVERCMAAGAQEDMAYTSSCMGQTGLRDGETDQSEDAGCNDAGDNTWLAPQVVKAGEKYVLLVSNVSTSGPGFTIRFGGTCRLPCDKEDPKPIAQKEKPKEKPKPTATPPRPAPVASTKPETIGGRKVEVGETLTVKNRTIKVKIWDSQVEDGDIVSIFIDDKKVLDRVHLRIKPQEFEIKLPPGKKEYYLTVYADDFGKSEVANTATVQIDDGVRQQIIDLVAERKKQESVKIVAE